MKEFTGQLIGGPDEGNFVTSSVPQFVIHATLEMKLDGEDADPYISITDGRYVWLPDKLHFKWVIHGYRNYTPKQFLEWTKNKYES